MPDPILSSTPPATPEGTAPLGIECAPATQLRTPRMVTIVAVIGIIFGARVVLSAPLGLISYVAMQGPTTNPIYQAMRDDPNLSRYSMARLAIFSLLGTMLLICSIGALMLRPWARRGMLLYAIAMAAMVLTNEAVVVFKFVPAIRQAASDAGAFVPAIDRPAKVFLVGMLGLIFPICILILLTRKSAKEAFAKAASAPRVRGPGFGNEAWRRPATSAEPFEA